MKYLKTLALSCVVASSVDASRIDTNATETMQITTRETNFVWVPQAPVKPKTGTYRYWKKKAEENPEKYRIDTKGNLAFNIQILKK